MGTRSNFISHVPTRIQIEGDERYIEIKPKLGQGDRLNLIDELLEMKAITNTAGVSAVAKYGAFVNALLRKSIVGWLLFGPKYDEKGEPVVDENGNPVMVAIPFDPDLIPDLDPDDSLIAKTVDEVVARNPLGVKRMPGAKA